VFTVRRRLFVLSIENVTSAYGRIEVLHGVTLHVDAGEIVTLIGANGAGKTTLLHAISGVQPITGGVIRFEGEPIERRPAHARVAIGISQVPEGRQLFTPLSVRDNLRLGAWSRRDADLAPDLARVCALFPMLDAILEMPAGALSGGQQQMLAIGRALMAKPRLLLLDEPSMGLAPNLVDHVLSVIRGLKDDSLTILLVEQNARAALAIADRAYVLETGRVALSGTAAEIQADRRVREAYLGI
jgi:branched-chain amino acid transport system ATP-binding protein